MESMEAGFLAKILVPDGAKDIPVGEVIISCKKSCPISFIACSLVLFIKIKFTVYIRLLLACLIWFYSSIHEVFMT
jgi:hypothetical protein